MARQSLSPGFRFHPTDVELVMYYLKRKLLGKTCIVEAIAEVNIYDFSPWDLPDKSNLRSRDLEWFFFCPKSRKYSSGSRTNRATETGYWKATGKDRQVEYKQKTVAMIKTLVFHLGHPPKGQRTDWVMHEYKMNDKDLADAVVVQDAYVLCRIFEKSGAGPKNGAHYGAPFNEEEWDNDDDDDVVGCSEPSATFGFRGVTKTHQIQAVVNITMPQRSLTEPGSSTITSSMLTNEDLASVLGGFTKTSKPPNRKLNNLATCSSIASSGHDDAMLTSEDIASIFGGCTDELNENKNEEVEIMNEKDTVNGDEDMGIYGDLTNLLDLQDLNDGALNILNRVDYTFDGLFMADDLDVNLGSFYLG